MTRTDWNYSNGNRNHHKMPGYLPRHGRKSHYDRKPRPFTPKDLARIIDHMRTQGHYNDYTIARAVTDSFGITNFICSLTKLMAFLQYIGFFVAIIMFLKAIRSLLKALKLLKLSPLAKLIEYGIGVFRLTLNYTDVVLYARFIVYLSIIESVIALAILYIDLGIGALSVFNQTNLICEALNVVGNWKPVAQSFFNLNDSWYGIINAIKDEHNNLKQYDDDIKKLDENANSINGWGIPDA